MRRSVIILPALYAACAASTIAVRPSAAQQPTGAAPGAPTEGVATRPAAIDARIAELLANRSSLSDSARLRRLFEVAWTYQNTEFPEQATYVGYPGQNARWTDRSLAAIARRKREARLPLDVLNTVDRSKLSAGEQLNYDLFRKNVEDQIEGQQFPEEYLPISQLSGPQQQVLDMIDLMPRATLRDYEDIVARLDALPAVIDQTIVLLAEGMKRGITAPRITLRDVPAQIDKLVPADPAQSALLRPFRTLPATIPPAEQARLRAAATRAYTKSAAPSFRKLRAYLAGSYIPRARASVGLKALPNGDAWYAYRAKVQTTTTMSPQQIHALGRSEVKRIRAQMDSLIASTGFQGSFADFARFLRTDRRFFFTDSASLVRAYRDIAKRVDPGLPKLFGKLPRLTYGVTTIQSSTAPSQTTAYYQSGAPEIGRPGWYYVNTYRLDMRPRWEMEVLSLHEAVPGHHLQISLAQEVEGAPKFRQYGFYTAFVEGWGLYSESLGPELGMYEDPYSKFGQLTYEMWRAIRLVVDTGIHSMGWSRQQAIEYFRANSAKTEHDITVEIDRYINDPGQALAYKIGELKLRELRTYAQQQLGDRFDIRAFHDEVLDSGALPLDVLEKRVRAWVAAQKGKAVATGASLRGPGEELMPRSSALFA